MALTETKQIDKIEVVGLGTIQVREATTILKDREPITQTYHRWTYTPGQDISDQPANVQAIAKAVWTKEVVDAYNAQVEASKLA